MTDFAEKPLIQNLSGPGFQKLAKFQCGNGHCLYDVGPSDGDYHDYATLRCEYNRFLDASTHRYLHPFISPTVAHWARNGQCPEIAFERFYFYFYYFSA